MAKAPTNLTESTPHGDEDLVEAGRKFADAMNIPVSSNEVFGAAHGAALEAASTAISLKATTLRGLLIKARMAHYCHGTVSWPVGENYSRFHWLVGSLLDDLLSEANQKSLASKYGEAA